MPNTSTPQELKAGGLIEKFFKELFRDGNESDRQICYGYAKQCALICVDEILNDKEDALDVMYDEQSIDLIKTSMQFWQQVRNIINLK